MHPMLYARPRPWLFLAFAPAVIGAVVILFPIALMGLLLILPGVSGLAGLYGLTLAWLGLNSPEYMQRRGPRVFVLLVMGLPAVLFGLSGIEGLHISVARHRLDWMSGMPLASASFGLLALFFLLALRPGHTSPESPHTGRTRLPAALGAAALLVAAVGLVVPAGYALVASGYVARLREQQGTEARALAATAFRAVQLYWIDHHGAQPRDNGSAGLPAAEAIHGRYVQSVRVDDGKVILTYGDEPLARWLGASTAGIELTFTAVDELRPGVLDQDGSYWACSATGFRDPRDTPVYFGDACY
jgi:hypothetical protein